MSLEDVRDYSVIAYTASGTVVFVVMFFFTVIIGLLTWRTISRVNRLLKNNVQPALGNVRETTETVRSTVSFISDNAIKPVVKVYGTYAGARRFIAVLARFRRPGRAS